MTGIVRKAERILQSETKGNVETLVFENQSYPNMRHRRAVFYVNKEFLYW